MGKILEQYLAEYRSVIASGISDGHQMVVKPEIWIMFKYLNDNRIEPWHTGFADFLEKTAERDPELAEVVAIGLEFASQDLNIGIEIMPGKPSECLGNGEHVDEHGKPIECCCDECDYFLQCFPDWEKGDQNG